MSQKKNQSFWMRKFKMILLRNDNLEEVGHLSLRPIHVLLLSVLSALVIIAITTTIIFYTPVRHLVPGYADISQNRVYMDLYSRVQELDRKTQMQGLYIEKMQNLKIK